MSVRGQSSSIQGQCVDKVGNEASEVQFTYPVIGADVDHHANAGMQQVRHIGAGVYELVVDRSEPLTDIEAARLKFGCYSRSQHTSARSLKRYEASKVGCREQDVTFARQYKDLGTHC